MAYDEAVYTTTTLRFGNSICQCYNDDRAFSRLRAVDGVPDEFLSEHADLTGSKSVLSACGRYVVRPLTPSAHKRLLKMGRE